MNLGLDLRGGMNVMMEVSTADVVRALSGYSADTFFNSVMEEAIQRNKIEANTNFVDVFDRVWNERDPNAQMAAIFSFEMNGPSRPKPVALSTVHTRFFAPVSINSGWLSPMSRNWRRPTVSWSSCPA